jgi:hypothetical protein
VPGTARALDLVLVVPDGLRFGLGQVGVADERL